ncbi:MAG TPA: hypothetical protein VER17_18875 [Tepidisphaeraceae bacterium]|nr:hypothetical protein [Tepidisphaeraceae bacterium]
MRKPISTEMHGVIDYLTVGTLAMLPKLLGLSRPLSLAVQSVAITKLCYTLMTDNELGVVRKLPMKAHLAMDCVSGATLAALPFLMEEEDEVATTTLVGLGLFELANAPMTQTTPSRRHLPRQAVRGVARNARGMTRSVRQRVGM